MCIRDSLVHWARNRLKMFIFVCSCPGVTPAIFVVRFVVTIIQRIIAVPAPWATCASTPTAKKKMQPNYCTGAPSWKPTAPQTSNPTTDWTKKKMKGWIHFVIDSKLLICLLNAESSFPSTRQIAFSNGVDSSKKHLLGCRWDAKRAWKLSHLSRLWGEGFDERHKLF